MKKSGLLAVLRGANAQCYPDEQARWLGVVAQAGRPRQDNLLDRLRQAGSPVNRIFQGVCAGESVSPGGKVYSRTQKGRLDK